MSVSLADGSGLHVERTNIKTTDPVTNTLKPLGTQRTDGVEVTFTGQLPAGLQVWSGFAWLDARMTKCRGAGRRCILDMHQRSSRRAEMPEHRAARRHAEQRSTDVRAFDLRPFESRIGERGADRGQSERHVARFRGMLVPVPADADDMHRSQLAQGSVHGATPSA